MGGSRITRSASTASAQARRQWAKAPSMTSAGGASAKRLNRASTSKGGRNASHADAIRRTTHPAREDGGVRPPEPRFVRGDRTLAGQHTHIIIYSSHAMPRSARTERRSAGRRQPAASPASRQSGGTRANACENPAAFRALSARLHTLLTPRQAALDGAPAKILRLFARFPLVCTIFAGTRTNQDT